MNEFHIPDEFTNSFSFWSQRDLIKDNRNKIKEIRGCDFLDPEDKILELEKLKLNLSNIPSITIYEQSLLNKEIHSSISELKEEIEREDELSDEELPRIC